VQIKSGQDVVASVLTDQQGLALFLPLKPAHYELTASKDGYEPLRKSDLDFSTATSIELTLVGALARHESIEVKEKAAPVDQGPSPPEKLPVADVKELPGRRSTVTDALPLVPGVVRVPGG